MTDRELLELAARAAGKKFFSYIDNPIFGTGVNDGETDSRLWNPLADDGDALRLAVHLRIQPAFSNDGKSVFSGYCTVTPKFGRSYHDPINEQIEPDPCAAWRRAVVRRAAAIGKKMK